jgi:hypothetical protein
MANKAFGEKTQQVYDHIKKARGECSIIRMRYCIDLHAKRKLDPDLYKKIIDAERELDLAAEKLLNVWDELEKSSSG